MKENSNAELLKFSKRAQEFLLNPQHFSLGNSTDLVGKKWHWNFSFEHLEHASFQDDKILTLTYKTSSTSSIETIFLETISRMLVGKSFSFLQYLSFRELENFLRDENHLPVFDNLDGITPKNTFEKAKISLQVSLIMERWEKSLFIKSSKIDWLLLTLVEKNQQILAFIKIVNKLFFPAKPLQLAMASSEDISIIFNEFPLNAEVLVELLIESLGKTFGISSFKVIAVQ